jgi:hypothetical protein
MDVVERNALVLYQSLDPNLVFVLYPVEPEFVLKNAPMFQAVPVDSNVVQTVVDIRAKDHFNFKLFKRVKLTKKF